ncbi:hypothetical protein KDK95_16465 [Actinospica sp. MGRD01-02]|uniref:Uncharacterized protein n=1 Tax=Actinospica acidithermotolerans TaxID=2828514 RepID=A0A941EB01_9ACTN|nr:hypothetical protein [Actinospica acidithermotolerans]MBR7827912.1 hypothetical protein [Actinospica acidithermotolerans]
MNHQSAGAIPAHIPGYEGGPFIHRPELPDEPLFILAHLTGACTARRPRKRCSATLTTQPSSSTVN